mmetsp:Transcript_23527/g.62913  ORF Transcript_23527/g.62913 Transcript_23527/m.62913 type:complete len:351 (-) Transcript_23527:66-1118(-)
MKGPHRAKLVRSNGLVLDGDVLIKTDGEGWDTAALLGVGVAARFQVSVQVLDWGQHGLLPFQPPCVVGVAPRSADLAVQDIEETAGAFLVYYSEECKITGVAGAISDTHVVLPGGGHSAQELQAAWERGLDMVYEDRTLSFGHCGHPHLKAPFRLDPLDYLPCISIGKEGVKIRVSVDAPERKRKLADADDGAAALKIARTLWSDRAFSDAVVVSPPRSIAVHRCVLAAASPFFARAFQGCMRESSEARVVIEDADADAVEALVRYLYTGAVDSRVDPAALLSLAHRFEVHGLLRLCAAAIVWDLAEDNVARSVAALRPFKDEAPIEEYWNALVDRLAEDRQLLQAQLAG